MVIKRIVRTKGTVINPTSRQVETTTHTYFTLNTWLLSYIGTWFQTSVKNSSYVSSEKVSGEGWLFKSSQWEDLLNM